MKNLLELIERYKDTKRPTHYGVFWFITPMNDRDRGYYIKNSDKKYSINSGGPSANKIEGLMLDENMKAETYEFNESVSASYWAADPEGKIPVSDEEIELRIYDFDDLHLIQNPDYVIRSYEHTLDEFYLHPYYPDKGIIGFVCVREIPYYHLDEYYEIEEDKDGDLYIVGDDQEITYWVSECLNFPEFFKPIYKNG